MPQEPSPGAGSGPTVLQVSLAVLAVLIAISLLRWAVSLSGLFARQSRSALLHSRSTVDEIEPEKLDAWAGRWPTKTNRTRMTASRMIVDTPC